MSASRIVLLRHGQTDFNLARRFQGRIDEPLNDSGRSQAAGAAGVLVSRLCEPSAEVGMVAAETSRSYDDGGVRIVCSPLVRALDTARILARVFDIAGYPCEGPVSDERLTERFYGTFEGKTYEEIAREQPEAYSEYRDTGECGGAEVERSEVVGERFRDAVLEAAAACRSDQSLIIVSHGSAIARGIISLMGLDPADFNGLRGVDNCHWSELVPVGVSTAKSAARTGWRLASHNIGAREDILGA
ncbi:histidine phosphatase family protein [uncultured Actinomyces sp.]|uniref:histidine phosphatase family protein n=1 Tax=uncultured Actinomyces sp. TaxID=249061 RepID=UPI0028E562D6|nr:histidine phosphatase family protein [uncultured Actinomyces sp.]